MFLGLDLGTTNVKVVVVDHDGSLVSQGTAPVDRTTTPDGGVEQDIDQIWDAACQAIREAVANVDAAKIQAVGISSQGGAMQLLDGDEKPIGRVISWLDERGRPFDRQIEAQWGEPYLVEHTGSNLSTTSLGQLLRLQQQSPEVLETAAGIGYVGDLIVKKLCGRRGHDGTNLSLAMLYNPSLGQADPDLLRRLKIDGKRLPDLLRATENAGPLRADAAAATGLPEGIPVSPAIHDQYAAAIGAGAVAEGDVLVGTGTAWVLLATTGRLAPPIAPRTFVCSHPVEGLFGQLLLMGNVGEVIAWALELIGRGESGGAALEDLIESVPPGADGLRFWSQLSTDRPTVAGLPPGGTLSGMTLAHSANHLLRAVIEGLACELARRLDWFQRADLPIKRLILSGPAASGHVIPQILASVTNRPVRRLLEPAVSAFGAATIARAVAHPEERLDRLALRLQPDDHTISTDANAEAYQKQLEEYLAPFPKNTKKD